jgi:hypothetical protein
VRMVNSQPTRRAIKATDGHLGHSFSPFAPRRKGPKRGLILLIWDQMMALRVTVVKKRTMIKTM